MKIVFRVLLIIAVVFLLTYALMTQVSGNMTTEQINAELQNTEVKLQQLNQMLTQTHDLANAKRDFGLAEDSTAIANLKENWNLLNEEKNKLRAEFEALNHKKAIKERYLGTFKCTAYINPYNNATANGGTTVPYKTIAVDRKVIPLGSKLRVRRIDTGAEYTVIANDTGGVIKGNKIDMVVNTNSEAKQWGVRNVEIWILND